MKGWLILSCTLAIGIVLGVGAMIKGPALVAPYLPKSISGRSERIEGEVVRKQREGNRLLVKVATAQGPMLITFTHELGASGWVDEARAALEELSGRGKWLRNNVNP